MSFLSRFSDVFLTKDGQLPVDRFRFGGVEVLLMRLGFAFLAFAAIKWEVRSLHDAVDDPEKLTGLAHVINLNWLQHLSPIWLWQAVVIGGLAFYVMGVLPVLGLFPVLFFSIGIGTLANSQGATNHSTQLVSMMLLGHFLVYLIPFGKGAPSGLTRWIIPGMVLHKRAAYVALVVFAASYVVSGWVKLDRSEGEWIERVPWLALELQKSNYSEYYDTLTPVPETLNTVVSLMNEHPNLARLFFGGGLFVELFAFLILLGRRWAFFYGLVIIVMHMSISHLMQLDFWYHMVAAFIFLVNVPGLLKTFRKPALA